MIVWILGLAAGVGLLGWLLAKSLIRERRASKSVEKITRITKKLNSERSHISNSELDDLLATARGLSNKRPKPPS